LEEEVTSSFGTFVASSQQASLISKLFVTTEHTFDKTTIMDSADQMRAIAASTTPIILDVFSEGDDNSASPSFASFAQFRTRIVIKATALHAKLRDEYLTGVRGPIPASTYLGKTKPMYEFIRKTLGIKMHGCENIAMFPNGIGTDDVSIGQNVSKIYEAIRDRQTQEVIISMFAWFVGSLWCLL